MYVVGSRVRPAQAHRFERHLLLGRAGGLLPLQRDQEALAALVVGHEVDDVLAAAEPFADVDLAEVLVAAALEGRQHHRLQHGARASYRVARPR